MCNINVFTIWRLQSFYVYGEQEKTLYMCVCVRVSFGRHKPSENKGRSFKIWQ